MKKLLILLGLGLGFCMVGPKGAYAAGLPLPAKAVYSLNYTTAVSTITNSPACIYQVVISTGAASEYVALFDSAPVIATSLAANSSTDVSLKTRILFGSTTTNTVYRFDPPLMFLKGIIAADSAITGQTAISYDYGYCGTN